MKKKAWQPYLDRLKENPEDAEALRELELILSKPSETGAKTVKTATKAGRFGVKMFLGKQLHGAVADGWDAWSAYFQGKYTSSTALSWPELETRDIAAALTNRFLRIGMFGIIVGLIPAIILAFQSALMIIQVWQVNVQNDIVREQNSLTRQQFAVGYSTQLKHQVYAGTCEDRARPETCTPSELPGVRADAVQALVRLADISHQGTYEGSRARVKGALLQNTDLSGMNFKDVELDRAVFHGASMSNTSFTGASLKGASFKGSTLPDTNLDASLLVNASFERARLTNASAKQANFQGASFTKAIIKSTDMSDARFYLDDKPVLRDRGSVADFSKAEVLSDVTFDGANLIKANFSQKSWLRLSFKKANLAQSSFAGASLTGGSMAGANLDGANLSQTTLIDVDLSGATFKGAKTSGIKLNNVTCPDGKKAQSRCTF